MLAFIVRWKIISRLVKRPRTLICVDPEFTNPNIASACPRERWNWYSKGRKRKREGKWRKGEGNGIKSREREKKKRGKGRPGGRGNRRIDRHRRIYQTVMRVGERCAREVGKRGGKEERRFHRFFPGGSIPPPFIDPPPAEQ